MEVDPEEFSAFAGMGEVSPTTQQDDHTEHIDIHDSPQPCTIQRDKLACHLRPMLRSVGGLAEMDIQCRRTS